MLGCVHIIILLTITALRAPRVPWPLGEFLKPLTLCQIPPPARPKAKAPPTSPTMRWGQGSLSPMEDGLPRYGCNVLLPPPTACRGNSTLCVGLSIEPKKRRSHATRIFVRCWW